MSNSTLRATETEKSPDNRPSPEPSRLAPINQDLLRGVQVAVEARLGTALLTVDEIMALRSGSVVNLDAGLGDCVGLYLNGSLIARCEIVAVGDKFGVRIVEIAASP